MTHTLHLGDCRTVLATLDDASIDSIVCDPPYELGFMGKAWDNSGIAYDVTVWQQCYRVLKPGGHLIAFGGSRTYHRLAVAIEDAGFEIRDQIQWIYGSGFPKSLDVSKALDKQAGAERTVVTEKREDMFGEYEKVDKRIGAQSQSTGQYGAWGNDNGEGKSSYTITAPATDLAKQWQGWGTALKPAHEPAVLARKPLCGTVADNVKAWGVGALNIDGTRVGYASDADKKLGQSSRPSTSKGMAYYADDASDNFDRSNRDALTGRWPANVIFDEEAAQVLDEQSGHSVSKAQMMQPDPDVDQRGTWQMSPRKTASLRGHSDSGGASRFFYVAKASKAEREAGLDGMENLTASERTGRVEGSAGLVMEGGKANPYAGNTAQSPRANHHPTVKPLALMRYLVRLVTPKGGKVLDPFMGSGSTGCAAVLEGCDFVGIDITPEYVAIAQKRIAHYAVETPLEGLL